MFFVHAGQVSKFTEQRDVHTDSHRLSYIARWTTEQSSMGSCGTRKGALTREGTSGNVQRKEHSWSRKERRPLRTKVSPSWSLICDTGFKLGHPMNDAKLMWTRNIYHSVLITSGEEPFEELRWVRHSQTPLPLWVRDVVDWIRGWLRAMAVRQKDSSGSVHLLGRHPDKEEGVELT